ncbi:MAG: hypothetical protein J6P72_04950, partial [Firmicutes bacterium]|nr:hypothetical protein [Bacillota bacterium]
MHASDGLYSNRARRVCQELFINFYKFFTGVPQNPKIFPQKKAEKKATVAAAPAKKGKKEDKKVEEKKKKDDEEEEFDGTVLRDRIFGKHVQTWMDQYDKKKDKQSYQFSQWKECL